MFSRPRPSSCTNRGLPPSYATEVKLMPRNKPLQPAPTPDPLVKGAKGGCQPITQVVAPSV